MSRYGMTDDDYADACDDAASDAASEARESAIESCIENDPVFVWKWRIVESAKGKLPSLRTTDPIKAKSLARRIKHLEKYCEEAISETLEEDADAASEARDPYAYRGLRRSDF